jgi:hypothetical protein
VPFGRERRLWRLLDSRATLRVAEAGSARARRYTALAMEVGFEARRPRRYERAQALSEARP